jgi:hypothetical protein
MTALGPVMDCITRLISRRRIVAACLSPVVSVTHRKPHLPLSSCMWSRYERRRREQSA